MKTYVGVGGVARRVSKMYVGVDNVARKVKKAYIGINGVARPFFGAGAVKYGTASQLAYGIYNHARAYAGSYALFAGGETAASTPRSNVNAYNASLTKSSPTSLSAARAQLAGTNVGTYALFAGGYGTTYTTNVDAYNSALTRSQPDLLPKAVMACSGVSIGEDALIGGGYYYSNSSFVRYAGVSWYDTSLTRATVSSLQLGRDSAITASNSKYAIFAGGNEGGAVSLVDAYNTSLTRSSAAELSSATYGKEAATLNDHILILGNTASDAYNASLTKVYCEPLGYGGSIAITVLDGYAVVAGGSSSGTAIATVLTYDSSLTKTLSDDKLTVARYGIHSATLGQYVLFAGGNTGSSTGSSVVDVYKVL